MALHELGANRLNCWQLGIPYGAWPHTGSPIYMNCTAHALFKTGSNLGGSVGEYWPSNSTGIDMRNFRREWRECSDISPDFEGSYNWTREIMQRPSGTRWQQSGDGVCQPMLTNVHRVNRLGR